MSIQSFAQDQSPAQQISAGVTKGLSSLLDTFHTRKAGESLATVLGLEGEQKESFKNLSSEQQKIAADVIKTQEKQEALTTEDKKYVQSIQNNFSSAKKMQTVLDSVEKILPDAKIGPVSGRTISAFDPSAQKIKTQLGTMFKVYEALYKGGRISDQKFKYIKELLPTINDTKAVFKEKLNGLKELNEEDILKGNKLLNVRKQHGKIPNNIFDLLETPENDTEKVVSVETPQEAQKTSQFAVGQIAVNPKTKQKIQWNGKSWEKAQ